MAKARKTTTPEKCPKVWEKARREKLKAMFDELSRLLPSFDPATPPSRPEIIQGAMSYIRQLHAQNEDLLKGGFDEAYRDKIDKWKKRVKELLCRVEQLTEILKTANIHIPPLAMEATPFWTKNRPKPWTKKIYIPEDKINDVLEKISHPKKGKAKSIKVSTVNVKKRIKKTVVKLRQSKENQPAIAVSNSETIKPKVKIASLPKKAVIAPLNITVSSTNTLPTIQTIPAVSFPKVISAQPQIIQQSAPILQGSIVAQPNTYILTNQGNLLPVLTPSTNVLTPVIINRPPSLFVVQQSAPTQRWKTYPTVMAKQPPNKRRIERESTVMTYSNQLPISALSKNSHARRSGKCAAHKIQKSNQTGLQPVFPSIASAISPTAAFLNSFPVVAPSKVSTSDDIVSTESTEVTKNLTDSINASNEKVSLTETLESQTSTISFLSPIETANQEASSVLVKDSCGFEHSTIGDKLLEAQSMSSSPNSRERISSIAVTPVTISISSSHSAPSYTPSSGNSTAVLSILNTSSKMSVPSPTLPTVVVSTSNTKVQLASFSTNQLLPSVSPDKHIKSQKSPDVNKIPVVTVSTSSGYLSSDLQHVSHPVEPKALNVSCSTSSKQSNQTITNLSEYVGHHGERNTLPQTVESRNQTTQEGSHAAKTSNYERDSKASIPIVRSEPLTDAKPPEIAELQNQNVCQLMNKDLVTANVAKIETKKSDQAFMSIVTSTSTMTQNSESSTSNRRAGPLTTSIVNGVVSTTSDSNKLANSVPMLELSSTNIFPLSSERQNQTVSTYEKDCKPIVLVATTVASSDCNRSQALVSQNKIRSLPVKEAEPAINILHNERSGQNSKQTYAPSCNIPSSMLLQLSTERCPASNDAKVVPTVTSENLKIVSSDSYLSLMSSGAPNTSSISSRATETHYQSHSQLSSSTPSIWPSYSSTPLQTSSGQAKQLQSQSETVSSQYSNVLANPFAPSWTPSTPAHGVSWPSITTSVDNLKAPQITSETSWLPIHTSIDQSHMTSVTQTEVNGSVEWRPLPSEKLWPAVGPGKPPDPWTFSSIPKQPAPNVTLNLPGNLSAITSIPNRTVVPHEAKNKTVHRIHTASGDISYNEVKPCFNNSVSEAVPCSTISQGPTYNSFDASNQAIAKVSKIERIAVPTSTSSYGSQTSFPPLSNFYLRSQSSTTNVPSSQAQTHSSISHAVPSRQNLPKVSSDSSKISSSVSTKITESVPHYVSSASKPLLGEPLFSTSHSGNYPVHDPGIFNSITDHGYSTALLKPTLSENTYMGSFVNSFPTEPSFSSQSSYSLSVSRALMRSEASYPLTASTKTQMSDITFFPTTPLDNLYPPSSGTSTTLAPKSFAPNSFPTNNRSLPMKPPPVIQYSENVQPLGNASTPSNPPVKNNFLPSIDSSQKSQPIVGGQKEVVKHNMVPTSSSSKVPSNECSNAIWNTTYFPSVQMPVSSSADLAMPWSSADYSFVPDSKDQKPKPPINWMTEPMSRTDNQFAVEDPFQQRYQNFLERKDPSSQNLFDYCLTNLPEEDGTKSKSKKKDGDSGCQDYFSWLSMKADPLVVPCTLPTLVGDLALGSEPTPTKKLKLSDAYTRSEKNNDAIGVAQEPFTNLSKNIFDCSQSDTSKSANVNDTIVLKNIFELPTPSKRKVTQGQNSFLSVSQLVEPHSIEEIPNKSNCTYYNPRAKTKRASGLKCSDKKCQQGGKNCSNYSAEALLKTHQDAVTNETNFSTPQNIFQHEFQDSPIETNHSTKPKTYSKQRKQDAWKSQDFQQSPRHSFAPAVIPPSSVVPVANFQAAKTTPPAKPMDNPFSFSYLPEPRLSTPQASSVSSSIPYPKFPANPPGPLFPGPSFPQQKPETVPFTNVLPPVSGRPCIQPDVTPPRYQSSRKAFTYSRTSKIPFQQFSPSFTYDNTKRQKSAIPGSTNVFPSPLPVTGPYPSFPALPSQPVGPTGSSLANFNLTTIFPEMNKKGYQYP